MLKEWQIVESQRDASHVFATSADGIACKSCGRPRWAHVQDGFLPCTIPSNLSVDPGCRYRGPHPRWSRPGSFSKKDAKEHYDAARGSWRSSNNLSDRSSQTAPQKSGAPHVGLQRDHHVPVTGMVSHTTGPRARNAAVLDSSPGSTPENALIRSPDTDNVTSQDHPVPPATIRNVGHAPR